MNPTRILLAKIVETWETQYYDRTFQREQDLKRGGPPEDKGRGQT